MVLMTTFGVVEYISRVSAVHDDLYYQRPSINILLHAARDFNQLNVCLPHTAFEDNSPHEFNSKCISQTKDSLFYEYKTIYIVHGPNIQFWGNSENMN
jgi:hypothetical protein